jgi:8-oxo-dGTP diphosphatase
VRAAARTGGALGAGLNRLVVVGAALVRDGRVLAARRVDAGGGWEFPGGKVEPGESPAVAIERECHEELGVAVQAVAELARAGDERIDLRLWHVLLLAGTPAALQDHDQLRWLARDELGDVAWLPVDRELLRAVEGLLS